MLLADRAFSCAEFAEPIREYIFELEKKLEAAAELEKKLEAAEEEIRVQKVEKEELEEIVAEHAEELDAAFAMVARENVALQAVRYKYKINRGMFEAAEREYQNVSEQQRDKVNTMLYNNEQLLFTWEGPGENDLG